MNHVAIDLGSKTSRLCVMSENGDVIEECDRPTARLRGFLGKQLTCLRKLVPQRSRCALHFHDSLHHRTTRHRPLARGVAASLSAMPSLERSACFRW